MITTLTLRVEQPKDRTLRILLPSDVPAGPLEVVIVIAPQFVPPSFAPTTDLAGRWRPYFPPDFDLDGALEEIRHEWEKEWTESET